MADYEIVAEGLGFPEGPVVMADGSVIVVEMIAGRITRCWNGRKETIRETEEGPNGAAIGPDGALYVCNSGRSPGRPARPGSVERVDLGTGRAERVYERCDGEALRAPNDLMFDRDGNVWFTDIGTAFSDVSEPGGLYCARPDGSSITRIRGGARSYNGVGISPDMATVYVADTREARLYAFDRRIEAQEPRLIATVEGGAMLDSLAMTAAGNVCVGTIMVGGIATITPAGDIATRPFDDKYVTNIAFGGEDMRDAWITLSEHGLLVKMRWDEPGMPLVFNA